MAKTKYIDLKSKNLEFERNDMLCKIQCLKTSNMTVEILSYKNDIFISKDNIPFAQLSKELKKIVKSI
jgi:hypothetical protein